MGVQRLRIDGVYAQRKWAEVRTHAWLSLKAMHLDS